MRDVGEGGSGPRPTSRSYEPALDGLRALCLIAVLCFHAGFSWASGGFLGVSTFFTLSGFLVGGLLLDEVGRSGRIDLADFWRRRLRRLAPASLWVLAALAIVAPPVLDATARGRLGADLLAALAQVANWRFLSGDYAYALLFSRPSLVQHFWSLSIEAQFYLVFPLVVAACAGARSPARRLGVVALAVSLTGVAMAVALGASPGHWDRIYYGSGLRLPELLAGVGLAVVLREPAVEGVSDAQWRGLGWAALAIAGAAWGSVALDTAGLYRGGLGGYALVSAVLVAACVRGGGGIRTLLASAPLVWIGRVSYGAYLIHWPIYVGLDAGWPTLSPLARFAICVPITLGLAGLSHAWLEQPVRRGRGLFGRRIVASTGMGMAATAALVVLTVSPGDIVRELRGADARPLGSAEALAAEGETKLAFFGDSSALSLALGFGRWSNEPGRSIHVTAGISRLGCGVLGPAWIDDLQAKGLDPEPWISPRGPFFGIQRSCLDFEEETETYLDGNPTDIAIVLFGEWDVAGVRVPGGERFRMLGEPEVDLVMKRGMHRLVDLLLAHEPIAVVWLTSPPLGRPHRFPHDDASWERARLRFNELLAEVAAERPGDLELVDLEAWVARGEAVGGGEPVRHDGIHFTLPGAHRVVDAGLGRAVLEAAARLRGEPGAEPPPQAHAAPADD